MTLLALAACQTPGEHRERADRVGYTNIEAAQQAAFGRSQPFTISPSADSLRRRLLLDQHLQRTAPASLGSRDIVPIPQWPADNYLTRPDDGPPASDATSRSGQSPLLLSLLDALEVAAGNSREYQTQKEQVFLTALQLDLEELAFRTTWAGLLDSLFDFNLAGGTLVAQKASTAETQVQRRFAGGSQLTALLALDLVQLLTQNRASSFGIVGDASLSIPLLRGSGRFVVTEPLTQAQRNVIYAVHAFEQFKRTFSVRIAADYLSVLEQLDQLNNSEENYRRLIASTRRAGRLADAGRLPEIQVDQALQNELRARNRWISARASYQRQLDSFKVLMGLPPDADVVLAADELTNLSVSIAMDAQPEVSPTAREAVSAEAPITLELPDPAEAGPYELAEDLAVRLALEHRPDLRSAVGRVFDAQRGIVIAADDLRADLTLLGRARVGGRRGVGSAGQDNASFRPERGNYSVLVGLDLPLERTRERIGYRQSMIDLERSVRDVQALEDRVKLDVRDALRSLVESRESMRIQREAMRVAQRRVDSTELFLQAGRAEIRDLLEAQEALISTQNALTSARVRYRVAELELQRDLGLLEVDDRGLWREFDPAAWKENGNGES